MVVAYVLCGLALIGFSATIALFCREQDIRPIRKVLRIFELPPFRVVFLLSLVIGLVHYAVSKGDGSSPQGSPPLFRSPALSLGSTPAHLDPPDEPLLPAWTNAVTNLLITGIARMTNGVVLGAARPPTAGYRSFDIWSSPKLDPPDWRIYGYSEFPEGAVAAIADGSITNRPAFNVSDAEEMMNPSATEDDVFLALAKHVPALSSPVGGN